MSPERRARLLSFLKDRALKRGSYTLSSGAKSDYYLDGKLITLDPNGIALVADAFLEVLTRYPEVQAIGGPVQGAIPIGTAVALRSTETGRSIPAFFVREKQKEHGTQKRVEGPIEGIQRVALVDDIITSGRSVAEAIRAVEAEDFTVVVVIALVDRESGGRELIEQSCPYEPIFTIGELKGENVHSIV